MEPELGPFHKTSFFHKQVGFQWFSSFISTFQVVKGFGSRAPSILFFHPNLPIRLGGPCRPEALHGAPDSRPAQWPRKQSRWPVTWVEAAQSLWFDYNLRVWHKVPQVWWFIWWIPIFSGHLGVCAIEPLKPLYSVASRGCARVQCSCPKLGGRFPRGRGGKGSYFDFHWSSLITGVHKKLMDSICGLIDSMDFHKKHGLNLINHMWLSMFIM